MKNSKTIKSLAAILLFLLPSGLQAQSTQTEPFTGVETGGIFSVQLIQGAGFDVVIQADDAIKSEVSVRVRNNVLVLDYKGTTRNIPRIVAQVTAPEFLSVKGSGASVFRTEGTLQSPTFSIEGSGASNFVLNVETDLLVTDLSGASIANLSGKATVHEIKISGASQAQAFNLETETSRLEISGASNGQIYATSLVSGNVGGTSTLSLKGSPLSQEINLTGLATIVNAQNKVVSESRGITDTVRVRIGAREVIVADGKRITTNKDTKRRSFRKNWTGLELGINGFMTPDYKIDLPADQSFLDLRYEKSLAVNLNLYQQNLSLLGDQVALYTGIGIGWNNYRLGNDILLVKGPHELDYVLVEADNLRKNKLTLTYLNIPLMLEMQNRARSDYRRFHMSAGLNLGVRIGSYTKQEYMVNNKKQKARSHEDFYINPFRYDLQARVGWGKLNFFATYSLNSLFRENRGPEVHPFSVGLRLVNFN